MLQRQQISKRFLTLSITLLFLVGILGFFSYRQIARERARYLTMLTLKGNTLIASLVAGTRVGMMGMFWSTAQLQALLEEIIIRDLDVQSLSVWNHQGKRIAEAGSFLTSDLSSLPGVQQVLAQRKIMTSMLFTSEGQEIFTLTAPFLPVAIDQTPGRSLQHRQQMWGMMQHRMPGTDELFIPENLVVTVGLRTTAMDKAVREEVWKTIALTLISLLGSGVALYFALGIEQARTIRRTLQEMRTYTQHIIDSMPNGLISVDARGKILTANPLAGQLLGISESALQAHSFAEIFQESQISLEDTLRTGKTIVEQEVEWRSSTGHSIPFSLSATPLRSDNGQIQGAVVMLRDLRDLRAMQEQVQRAERFAALGRLAAGVAHEIRNPLGAIKGLAQYFQRKWKDRPEEQSYAEVIVREVDRLNRVVTDLLEFARVRPPQFALLDISSVVQHAVALVEPDVQAKGARITVRSPATLPLLYADRDQMTQALLNILLNAVDAVTAGDDITITIAERKETMGYSHTSLQGEEIEIRIQDTGCGIPPANLPQLFDPFFTTKEKGTGLGLAIAHQVVVQHQGTIQVESTPGHGTTFILRFPIKSVPAISPVEGTG